MRSEEYTEICSLLEKLKCLRDENEQLHSKNTYLRAYVGGLQAEIQRLREELQAEGDIRAKLTVEIGRAREHVRACIEELRRSDRP